jgi:hypothetical protein
MLKKGIQYVMNTQHMPLSDLWSVSGNSISVRQMALCTDFWLLGSCSVFISLTCVCVCVCVCACARRVKQIPNMCKRMSKQFHGENEDLIPHKY